MRLQDSLAGHAMVAALPFLFVLPLAAQVTFTTADGTGADTFLANDTNTGPTSVRGANTIMNMRRFDGTRSRQPLFRFDIGSLSEGANTNGATLSLIITRSANRTVAANVYGLIDETLDSWPESSTSYSNAPGASPATAGNYSYSIYDEVNNPTGKYKLLGTINFPTTANTTTPIVSNTTSLNLDSFLADDTNGLVTFLIIPGATNNTGDWDIASKENTTSAAPLLTLPNVITDSDGDNLLDDWEILYFSDWPSPGQADPLRFNGTDDPDLDGQYGLDNLTEQSLGSDPTTPAATLVWQGGENGDEWDTAQTLNWFDGTGPSGFLIGDVVSFTDLGAAHSTVSLVSSIKPSSLSVDASADYTFTGSGTLTGITGLEKSGSGNLTLATANSYTGDTTVNAGTLTLGAIGAVPGAAGSGIVTLAGGTVDLNGFSATFNEFSGAGVVDTTAGTASTLTLANSGDSTFSGYFQNTAGSLTLVKGGFGLLTLSGNSTHSGGTFIGINNNGTRVGTIRAVSSQALGSGPVTIGSGGNDASATLEVDGGITLANAITLPGRNNSSLILDNVSGNNSLTGAFTLTTGGTEYSIGSAAGTLTLGSVGNPIIAAIPNSATRNLNLGGAGNGIIVGDLNLTNGTLNMQINKSGAGTWSIAGALLFTGNTTVTEGILSIATDDVFDDNSTVTLASNSSLNLTHNGTDQVGVLIIDNITQPDGDYTFGTGKLRVGNPSAGYADWASTHAPTGDPDDDFDGDGVANAVEYVLGGTKDSQDSNKLPTLATSGGNLVLTFVRDQLSIDGSTTVQVQVGTNLIDWPLGSTYNVPDAAASASPGVSVIKDSPTSGKDTVILSISQAPDLQKFARLKVIATP